MQRELELFLSRAKGLQDDLAHARLSTPQDPTVFGYGVACGEYRGLGRAVELLEEVMEEVANDERTK